VDWSSYGYITGGGGGSYYYWGFGYYGY
jgi:hypothetical protein